MESPNDQTNLPGSNPLSPSGSKGYSSDKEDVNNEQSNKENQDPSTWPSGKTSLDDIVKDNDNLSDTRIEGDHSAEGKDNTIGNP